jgi:hypothetical protein
MGRHKRKHIIGLGVFVFVVLCGLLIYFRFNQRVPQQWTEEVVTLWRSRSYISFTDHNKIVQIVDKIPVDLQTSLTEPQHKALRETLVELLDIYHTGNYGQFAGYVQKRKGRMGPGGAKRLNSISLLKMPLDKLPQEKSYMKGVFRQWRWPPSTDAERLKAWWVVHYYKNGVWKGIDTRDAKITVFEHEAASLSVDYIFSQMSKFASEVGGQARGLTWRFFDFPTAPKQDKHKYALVYFTAEHHAPDPPWPTYLWLRWENSLNNWYMDKYSVLYAGERQPHSEVVY